MGPRYFCTRCPFELLLVLGFHCKKRSCATFCLATEPNKILFGGDYYLVHPSLQHSIHLQILFVQIYRNEQSFKTVLAIRAQQVGETLDQYLQAVHVLANDCNYNNVTVQVYKEGTIRDDFISGISTPHIRQKLLENKTLPFTEAENQAQSVERAILNSVAYSTGAQTSYQIVAVSEPPTVTSFSLNEETQNVDFCSSAGSKSPVKENCFFWGGLRSVWLGELVPKSAKR